MTREEREEAKHRLLSIERSTPIHTRDDARDFEALEMAIQALSQEPCQKDCRLCKEFDKCVNGRKGHENGTSIGYSVGECKDFEPCDDCIFEEGSKYCIEHCPHEARANKPCDDAISREWLMRKATERFYTTNYFNHISAMIEEAPSVTQKPIECKDVVSRDAVLDIICRETEWYDIRTQINDLPSVTQKSGKWIVDLQTATEDYYICSECGRRIHLLYPDTIDNYPYCPNCGAKMESEVKTDAT